MAFVELHVIDIFASGELCGPCYINQLVFFLNLILGNSSVDKDRCSRSYSSSVFCKVKCGLLHYIVISKTLFHYIDQSFLYSVCDFCL